MIHMKLRFILFLFAISNIRNRHHIEEANINRFRLDFFFDIDRSLNYNKFIFKHNQPVNKINIHYKFFSFIKFEFQHLSKVTS